MITNDNDSFFVEALVSENNPTLYIVNRIKLIWAWKKKLLDRGNSEDIDVSHKMEDLYQLCNKVLI